jgi:quercetin dioxygenase-like cupin family protein
MAHVRSDSARPIEVEPGLFGIKLIDGETGSHGVALLRGWLRPGARHSPHTHTAEEAVVFLSGDGVVWIGGHRQPVGPGDAVWIPPGVVHSTENTCKEDLTFVAAFSDSLITSRAVTEERAHRSVRPRGRHPLVNRLRWVVREIRRRISDTSRRS